MWSEPSHLFQSFIYACSEGSDETVRMKGCQLQGKVCAQSTGWPLIHACPDKCLVRWTDRPAMTIAVDVKQQNKQTKTGSSVPWLLAYAIKNYNINTNIWCAGPNVWYLYNNFCSIVGIYSVISDPWSNTEVDSVWCHCRAASVVSFLL